MTPPWMLVRLALDTSLHHQPADDDRLAAIDIKSVGEYVTFLRRVYGFEAAVEEAIAGVGLEPMITHGRFKAPLLRSDLEALHVPCDVPRAQVVVRSAAHAIGWLFVVERHTLLAGLICRHIQRTLLAAPTAYLSAYGDTLGIRFRALGDALGAYAQRHSPRTIVSGALEAFRAQRQWYQHGSQPASPIVEEARAQ